MGISDGIMRNKNGEDRISSPDQLNGYIKISNPLIWIVLIAFIVLLVGVCVWGVFGRLTTTLDTVVVSESGEAVCYIREAEIGAVKTDLTVMIDGKEYAILSIPPSPVSVAVAVSSYAMHVGMLSADEFAYEVKLDALLDDGVYKASIVTESVAPISFLLN